MLGSITISAIFLTATGLFLYGNIYHTSITMPFFKKTLGIFGLAALASATKHQLIIGSFSTNFLYTAEYDDVAETLQLIGKTPTDSASSWISLSVSMPL